MSAAGRGNRVRLLLVVVAAAALALAGFVSLAPNRLVSGRPLPLWTVGEPAILAALALLGALLLAAALARQSAALHHASALLAGALLLLLVFAAGRAGTMLIATAGPVARVSLGAGFWIGAASIALAILDAFQRLRAGPFAGIAAALALCAGIAAMAAAGIFDKLSLMIEYRSHEAVFVQELGRHLLLVLGAVGAGLVLGVPLGIRLTALPGVRGSVFAALNLLQTIPSVALFGLLIAPLSLLAATFPALQELGIRGIGMAPALIALTCYALLPIVRYTYTGFAGVDPDAVEAALGMGFTRGQIRRRIEFPLALPMLLAGLRIVLVQSIGLAVVAALIGAGGLGTFVFQGIGQDALDLVLLGTIPTIFLALSTDFLLKAATSTLERRPAR